MSPTKATSIRNRTAWWSTGFVVATILESLCIWGFCSPGIGAALRTVCAVCFALLLIYSLRSLSRSPW